MSARGAALVAMALGLFGVGYVAGCSTASNQCDCTDPSVHLAIPPESAAAVVGVRLSGPACAAVAPPSCAQTGPEGGCASFRFAATAAGNCHIEVDFANGVFAHDVSIRESSGCCAGFYPDPASAGEVAVTPPSGASTPDGGGVADAGDGG